METRQERPRANNPLMPAAERALIAERLALALDEIETGPADAVSLQRAATFQNDAAKILTRRANRMIRGEN